MTTTTNHVADMRRSDDVTAADLVLCTSADGWSLHAPGATDEQIAEGEAPYLVCGDGQPTDADYTRALDILRRR